MRPDRHAGGVNLPGDELVPDASIVMDRSVILAAAPADVWPWIVQLGKGRAGWYLPAWLVPIVRHRAATDVRPELQRLEQGDRVPDWGPGDPHFDVVLVDAPRALVYMRAKPRFSWALTLHDVDGGHTLLHIRLRVAPKRRRLARVLRPLLDFVDWLTIVALFAGLRERLA